MLRCSVLFVVGWSFVRRSSFVVIASVVHLSLCAQLLCYLCVRQERAKKADQPHCCRRSGRMSTSCVFSVSVYARTQKSLQPAHRDAIFTRLIQCNCQTALTLNLQIAFADAVALLRTAREFEPVFWMPALCDGDRLRLSNNHKVSTFLGTLSALFCALASIKHSVRACACAENHKTSQSYAGPE